MNDNLAMSNGLINRHPKMGQVRASQRSKDKRQREYLIETYELKRNFQLISKSYRDPDDTDFVWL